MLQGGSRADGERSSGRQHRKRQRRLAEPQGGGAQPVPTPGRSNGSAAVRGRDGAAASGASDAAQQVRKRGRDSVPSLGGSLRIFRSALAIDEPSLCANGHKQRAAGRGGPPSSRVGKGASSGGADGSSGTQDLELLRQRALAAHAVSKP